MPFKKIEVLLVEDNPGDVDLVKEAVVDWQDKINMSTVRDGEEALSFLSKQEPFSKAVRPDLIILDLNLPRKDGREFLQEIKSTDIFKAIPVIVLTTSDAERDIHDAYCSGASCFISKPIGMDKFSLAMQALANFWFLVVKLPPHERSG